jgi:hypothetical protein
MSEETELSSEQAAALTIARLADENDQLRKLLFEAMLILSPFTDWASDLSDSSASDSAALLILPGENGCPRIVHVSVGHLRWARKWRQELAT